MALRFEGRTDVRAPRERVWGVLTDPQAMSTCLPDVQQLDVLGEGRFRAVVRVGVGFIKGNFAFDVTMSDLRPPAHAVLAGRGGGLGSAVDVRSVVDLVDGPGGGTTVQWTADVVISGPLATVGGRVLNNAVEKKAGELFDCLKARVEA
jgi:carbon monoxide dehydrogenase subunit G